MKEVKFIIIVIVIGLVIFFSNCNNYNKELIVTDYGDQFQVICEMDSLGAVYYLSQEDSDLNLLVGKHRITKSDFVLIYNSDSIRAYLFDEAYLLLSLNGGSYQIIDENRYDLAPEINQIISSIILYNRATMAEYYRSFAKRNPEMVNEIKRLYYDNDYDKLVKYGLPLHETHRREVILFLENYFDE